MPVTTTLLRYWKTEHTEETCQDAASYDAASGVFAIADGVGSSSFAALWASALVSTAVKVPLNSDDLYEVDWWLGLARSQYTPCIPDWQLAPTNTQRANARKGAYSTLLQARLSRISCNEMLLSCIGFGDSCCFVYQVDAACLNIFPGELNFDAAPVSLAANPAGFNPVVCRPASWLCQIRQTDTFILATDAIARWICSCGHGKLPSMHEAYQHILKQTPQTWAHFVEQERATLDMVNDDCTVLKIVPIQDPCSAEEIRNLNSDVEAIRQERWSSLMNAFASDNKMDVARAWGDGSMFSPEAHVSFHEAIQNARNVATSFYQMLAALVGFVSGGVNADIVKQLWNEHAAVLVSEPCAKDLVTSLRAHALAD